MPASSGSRLILLGFLLLTALLLVLVLGPLGMVLVPLGLILAGFVMMLREDDEGGPTERVNCADCGSPNATDAEECSYCGTPL